MPSRAGTRPGIAKDLDRAFDLFPILKERRAQPAGTFSGGEQQMLAIGRAMMSRPKLLMLDEPSMGLSPLMMQRIMSTITELQREGVTILLVEQNAQAALSLADYGYVLEVGKIVLREHRQGVAGRRERPQSLSRRGLTHRTRAGWSRALGLLAPRLAHLAPQAPLGTPDHTLTRPPPPTPTLH